MDSWMNQRVLISFVSEQGVAVCGTEATGYQLWHNPRSAAVEARLWMCCSSVAVVPQFSWGSFMAPLFVQNSCASGAKIQQKKTPSPSEQSV